MQVSHVSDQYQGCSPNSLQVRGTPASGKSTLAKLLAQHIKSLELDTPLIWIDDWPDAVIKSNTWEVHLDKNKGFKKAVASVLIVDEAQTTYGDGGLWNTFFKDISDNPQNHRHRIIIFTSYGSPTRINAPGTPMLIKDPQMVTLVHIDHHDKQKAAGLYLTQPEFDGLVNLDRHSLDRHSFDPALYDFLFQISCGHVGAIKDMIGVITCHDVSLFVLIRVTVCLTLSPSRTAQSEVPGNHSPF